MEIIGCFEESLSPISSAPEFPPGNGLHERRDPQSLGYVNLPIPDCFEATAENVHSKGCKKSPMDAYCALVIWMKMF
jgi:hypothetical protein